MLAGSALVGRDMVGSFAPIIECRMSRAAKLCVTSTQILRAGYTSSNPSVRAVTTVLLKTKDHSNAEMVL